MLTRKGGAKNTLPFPATYQEVKDNWDFFFVCGHGRLDNRLMIVPPDTYILNLATAGRPCSKLIWNVDNLIFDNNPKEHMPEKTLLEKIYKGIKDKTFLREISRKGDLEHIYTPGTTALNVEEQYTSLNKNGKVPSGQTSISFYEPGDIMFDTNMKIQNDFLPIGIMGAYKLPIPFKFREQMFEVNKIVFRPGTEVDGVSEEDYIGLRQGDPRALATPAHHDLMNVPENILSPIMFPSAGPQRTDFHLSEVVNYVNTNAAPTKTRVYFIRACRSTSDEPTAQRMRRFSIAARGNRERVGIVPATVVANPQKKFRTALNKELLVKLRASLEKHIVALQAEKIKKEQEDEAVTKSKKTFNQKLGERFKISARIAEIDARIPVAEGAIQKIDTILNNPQSSFKMEDVLSILEVSKEAIQPELKALLEIK
jgi:hypothetical protein